MTEILLKSQMFWHLYFLYTPLRPELKKPGTTSGARKHFGWLDTFGGDLKFTRNDDQKLSKSCQLLLNLP